MSKFKLAACCLVWLFSTYKSHGQQNTCFEANVTRNDKLEPFANLFHNHHDFFGKAFSFQGLEGGILINRSYFAGVYGSAFVSNLNATIGKQPAYIWIGQFGIMGGTMWHADKKVYPGCQLNLGYFTLRADENDFGILNGDNAIRTGGLVLSPQAFAGFRLLKWLHIRTGLAYNLYVQRNPGNIQNTDLDNISFNFGFVVYP